jgi:hypothetical protein
MARQRRLVGEGLVSEGPVSEDLAAPKNGRPAPRRAAPFPLLISRSGQSESIFFFAYLSRRNQRAFRRNFRPFSLADKGLRGAFPPSPSGSPLQARAANPVSCGRNAGATELKKAATPDGGNPYRPAPPVFEAY